MHQVCAGGHHCTRERRRPAGNDHSLRYATVDFQLPTDCRQPIVALLGGGFQTLFGTVRTGRVSYWRTGINHQSSNYGMIRNILRQGLNGSQHPKILPEMEKFKTGYVESFLQKTNAMMNNIVISKR